MKYNELLPRLQGYRVIIVSGPQRSGTTFASKVIAFDLSYQYIDEAVFDVHNVEKWLKVLENRKIVVQCPTMCRYLHLVALDDVVVVFMRRKIEDIVASEQRINWGENQRELERYGIKEGRSCEVKINFWNNLQKNMIKNAFELEYESLASHPLWIGKDKRKNFSSKETGF